MADLDKIRRRLRVRVDVYDRSKQIYKPFPRQSLLMSVEDLNEQYALWRSLETWGRARDWDETVRAKR